MASRLIMDDEQAPPAPSGSGHRLVMDDETPPRGESEPITFAPVPGKGPPVRVMPRAAKAPAWATEQDAPEHEDNTHFSAAESALNGAGQAVTLDHADELSGLMSAHEELGARMRRFLGLEKEKARTEDESEPTLSEAYAQGRDMYRAQDAQAKKDNPWAYRGGAVTGDVLAQTALAGLTGGASLTPAGQGAIGAVSGEGSSEKPLASLETAKQAGIGGGVGFIAGKAGEYGGELLKDSRVGKYLAGKVGAAEGDAALEVARKRAKDLAAGVGKLGAETSAGRNALSVAEEVLTSSHSTPEQIALAKQILASPEAGNLARGVFDSALERLPSRLGGIQRASSAIPELAAAASPAGVVAGTEERLAGPVGRVLAKYPHFINKLLPVAAGLGGAAIGHPGMGAGLATILAFTGHGGTVIKKLINDPSIRRASWKAVEYAITNSPEALGKFGPFLAREYARDPEHARAVDEALTAEDPEYAARKLSLLQGGGGGP